MSTLGGKGTAANAYGRGPNTSEKDVAIDGGGAKDAAKTGGDARSSRMSRGESVKSWAETMKSRDGDAESR